MNTFRTSNASDYITNGKSHQSFPKGIDIFRISLPSNIKNKRNFLYKIGESIVLLNQHMTEGDLLDYLHSVVKIKRIFPNGLSDFTLIKISENVFKDIDYEKELIPNTKRKILFSDDFEYKNKKDIINKKKRTITNKEIGKIKSEQTEENIYNTIIDWSSNKKITQKEIAKELNLNEKTIRRHWSTHIKSLCKFYNEERIERINETKEEKEFKELNFDFQKKCVNFT